MKLSYSKLLLRGVIATTLLMSMSCQKKGSARGVQPQTATKTDAPEKAEETHTQIQDPSLTNIPEHEETVPTSTSGDGSKVTPAAEETKVEDKAAVKPEVKGQPGSESNPIQLEEVVVVGKKPNSEPTEGKECSTEVVSVYKSTLSVLRKVKAEEAVSTTTQEASKKNYEGFLAKCDEWNQLFAKENIASCIPDLSNKDSKKVDVTVWDPNCMHYGMALKALTGVENTYSVKKQKTDKAVLDAIKAAKFVVSDNAKEMFSSEHTNWKMFIVDGELQTDALKLADAVKANKVACTILVTAEEKYDDSQDVVVEVKKINDLAATEETDTVQKGVIFGIDVKAVSKTATAEEKAQVKPAKSMLSCSNLKVNDLKIDLLKKALGKHISVAAPAETKAEAPVEKEEPKAQKQN